MSKLLFDGIFNFVETYFAGIGANYMKTLDILFYVFVGLELFFVIFFMIKSHFAYQFRLIRAVDKINIYLLNNSYINENNLIEFNKKMKKVPKTLRYHWQQYMLYREHAPSYYMSSNNCIDKPMRSSSVINNLKTMKALTVIFAALSLLLSAAVLGFAQGMAYQLASIIFKILIIPSLCIVFGGLYNIFQNSRQAANLSDLYQTFHIYQRLMDKAVSTIPDYVDFEVLFTKKEIAKGIPALNEYLEKRARQEQEELEKARRNAVEHEVYDFGSVDISGSLILDRAMKETEIYLSLRNRLLAEIRQVESQIETLKKSYENTQREIQRKMQTAKENINRIRMQQESSTNRIEGNYLKKQQDTEIQKLTQLEKDNTEETFRFNQELEVLSGEIDKKKAELEERRQYIETAMLAEYKTYSTKVFKNLIKVATDKEKEERAALNQTKDAYAQQVIDLKDQVQELTQENDQLKLRVKNFDSELSEKETFYTNALIETAEKAKSALGHKSGEVELREQVEEAPVETQPEQPVEVEEYDEPVLLPEAEVSEDEQAQEFVEDNQTETEEQVEEAPVDEYEGYYDSEGYYRYPNGTYYDPQGRYFDESGGYFDIDGNYHTPDEAQALLAQIAEEKAKEQQERELAEAEEAKRLEEEEKAKAEEEARMAEELAKQIEAENDIQEPAAEQPEVVAPMAPAIDEVFEQADQPEVKTADNKVVVPAFEIEDDDEPQVIVVRKKAKSSKPKRIVIQEPEDDYDDYEEYDEYSDYEEDDYEDYDEAPRARRGRPRKTATSSRGPGRPRKEETKKGPGRPKKEEPAKKGPGRPKKEEEKRGPGRPAGSTAKPGRPKKEEVRGPGRPKKEEVRGPGRPKKEVKKGPGRPKKEEVRGPGRPKKEVSRGPGRPPKKKGPGRPKKK